MKSPYQKLKTYKRLTRYQIKEVERVAWGPSLNWIYLVAMRAHMPALLFFFLLVIPILNIPIFIILIFMGRGLAWKYRHWSSFNEFLKVQEKWDRAAKFIWLFIVPIAILFTLTVIGMNALPAEEVSINQPAPVGNLVIEATQLRRFNQEELATLKACEKIPEQKRLLLTPSDYEYCPPDPIPEGYQGYVLALKIKNSGEKDFEFSNGFNNIEKGGLKFSTAGQLIKIPKVFGPQLVVIPPDSEKEIQWPFKLREGKTQVTIVTKPYSNAEIKFDLEIP